MLSWADHDVARKFIRDHSGVDVSKWMVSYEPGAIAFAGRIRELKQAPYKTVIKLNGTIGRSNTWFLLDDETGEGECPGSEFVWDLRDKRSLRFMVREDNGVVQFVLSDKMYPREVVYPS
jgi:hypothetical protein